MEMSQHICCSLKYINFMMFYIKIIHIATCVADVFTIHNATHPVPQPGVEVSLSRSGTLYAGTALTLTCTVTLDSNVGSGESVETAWSGLQDIPEQRYSVTGASGSGGSYTGSLTISPLADQDDGTFTCTVTVTGGRNILHATARDNITITVIGENNTAKFDLLQFSSALNLSSDFDIYLIGS